MVFTASQRAAIAENDPTWLLKLRIRIALTILLFIPLGCLASVVSYSSNFQSPAFQYDTRVWPCLLLIVLSLIWNVITVAVYTKWKRPLNPLIQLLVHGILTLLFIIVGAVATHNAATASSLINNGPYAPAPGTHTSLSEEGHTIRADNGSMVVVTSENEKSCPAFASCTAQATWMQSTQHRAGVAIAGCALFLLLMPIHLLLTVLFIRDYRERVSEQSRLGSDAFPMDTTPTASQTLQRAYAGTKFQEQGTTSQVHLLREGRGGLGFHKPQHANDSVLSMASEVTNQPRPSTANTARSRARFMRPKSTGPSLPLAFPLSRSGSKASTIASRRRSNASTIASRRRRSADTAKDLPPVPTIDTSRLRVSVSDSLPPLTPDTAILTRSPISPPRSADLQHEFPGPKSLQKDSTLAQAGREHIPKRKKVPAPLEKPSPPKLSVFPQERPLSPPPITTSKIPTTAAGFNKAADVSPVTTLRSPTTPAFKISFEQPTSPAHDPFSRAPFDHDELSALPAMPPEGFPRKSKDASRPTSSMGGLGELDMLRSLRSTLFASDADTQRSRSSLGSGAGSNGPPSPFARSQSPSSFLTGNSGRQSPWTARKERRQLLKEIENERELREKELLEAEQKAHRAAEKMESAYLRDELKSADEKSAMRKKRIEDRIQKLKDTLEDLKRVQEEEERRAEERAEKERQEEEEFQHEMARYGNVVAARVVEHRRQESEAKSIAASNTVAGSRPTTRGGETTRPTTRGTEARPATSDGRSVENIGGDSKMTDKALPPMPPTVREEEDIETRMRYSWETGLTVAHTKSNAPG